MAYERTLLGMIPPHHGPDGRFRNPWPGNVNPGLGDMLRFFRERRRAAPTGTPARHFSARGLGDRNRSLWCGFTLESAGSRVYFAGDSAYHPEFGAIGRRCGPFDLVMIPIGAYDPRWFMQVVHLDPDEAVRVYQDLVATHPGAPLPLMLGIHWGTFRLTTEAMDEPPRRTAEQWRAVGFDPDRLWIAKFGETRRVK